MKEKFLQSYYIYVIVIVVAAVFILLFALFYKRQISNEIFFKRYGENVGNWVKRNECLLNLVVRGIEVLLALAVIIANSKLIADFPHLLNNDYLIMEKEITEVQHSDRRAKVLFDEDTSWYQLNIAGVQKGDLIKIYSLPISKMSIVTELNGKKIFENMEDINE